MLKINIYSWDKAYIYDYMSHYVQNEREEYVFEIWDKVSLSEAEIAAKIIEKRTGWNTRVFTRCEKKEVTVLDHYYGPAWGYQYHTELQKRTITCIAVAKKPFAKYRRLFY